MAHDVFISYSSEDKPIADAVCATLERSQIRCWIAPRDILPSQSYGEAIVEAINSAKLMVLVFSSSSNSSPQVLREVERAVSKEIPIVPFRIAEVAPTKSMEYFLSAPHWLDAITPPIEQHLKRLVEVTRSVVFLRQSDEQDHFSERQTSEVDVDRFDPSTAISHTREKEFSRTILISAVLFFSLTLSIVVGAIFFRHEKDTGTDIASGLKNQSDPQSRATRLVKSTLEESLIANAVGRVVLADVLESSDFYIETPESTATAFCISPKGYFLTSKHAVESFSTHQAKETVMGVEVYRSKAIVLLLGERRFNLKLLHLSPDSYFAILGCDESYDFGYFALSLGSALKRLSRVQSLGMGPAPGFKDDVIVEAISRKKHLSLEKLYPMPFTVCSATAGGVIEVEKSEQNHTLVFHTAQFQQGSLGGPLIDDQGRVVGINLGVKTDGKSPIFFALGASQIQRELADILPGETTWSDD